MPWYLLPHPHLPNGLQLAPPLSLMGVVPLALRHECKPSLVTLSRCLFFLSLSSTGLLPICLSILSICWMSLNNSKLFFVLSLTLSVTLTVTVLLPLTAPLSQWCNGPHCGPVVVLHAVQNYDLYASSEGFAIFCTSVSGVWDNSCLGLLVNTTEKPRHLPLESTPNCYPEIWNNVTSVSNL